MRFIISTVAMAIAAFLFISCRTAPIQDVTDAHLLIPTTASAEDIDEAIWRAGRKLGWSIAMRTPGHLRGTLHVRQHVAIVSIAHDGRRFSIRYEGSENLRQKGHKIHKNYNLWVQRLANKIEAEAAITRTSYVPGG